MLKFAAVMAGAEGRHLNILQYALSRREHVMTHWYPLWDELCEFYHPDREGFFDDQREGEERRDNIYGSVSELAARSLTSHVATALRPPGRTWFKAKAKQEQLNSVPEVRAWCDIVTRITYAQLYDPRVRFEQQCAHADRDLVVIGTAALQIGWERAKKHLTVKTHHMKNVVLSVDASGQHDMAFVFWPLTIRQITQMFPESSWPSSVRDKFTSSDRPDLEEVHEILHACLPNADYQKFGGKMGRFPYSSMWISTKDKELITEGGYWDFPYVTPRWDTATAEVYGRSPGMVALRDARLHDAMTRSFVDAAETALMPPLMAPFNSIRGGIDLRPRGLTFYDLSAAAPGAKPLEPIQLGSQPDKAYEFLLKIEERINAAFFRDVLELPRYDTGDKMTAAETNARLDQYLRQAAPVLTRLEATYNAGVVNRVFSILAREGLYPEAPEMLQGEEIEFDFESPMKAARDKAEALKIMEGLGMIAQLGAATGNPMKAAEVADNIDFDVTARLIGYRADLPEVIFTPIKEMLDAREGRAKQAKIAQMAELAHKAGPAVAGLIGAAGKAKEQGLIDTDNPAQLNMQPNSEGDPSKQIEGSLAEMVQ